MNGDALTFDVQDVRLTVDDTCSQRHKNKKPQVRSMFKPVPSTACDMEFYFYCGFDSCAEKLEIVNQQKITKN